MKLSTQPQGKQVTSHRRSHHSPLLEAASDFVQKSRPTQQEIDTFKELFYTLALKSRYEENRELSIALSQSAYTPRSIALFFALDNLDSAAPMLLNSTVLGERDLLTMVLKNKLPYNKVIAQRTDLTTQLVSALLSVDDKHKSLLSLLNSNTSLAGNPEIQNILSKAKTHKLVKPDGIVERKQAITNDTPLLETDGTRDLSGALLTLASKSGKLGKTAVSIGKPIKKFSSETEVQLLRASRNFNKEAFGFCVQSVCSLPQQTTVEALIKKDTGFLAMVLCALQVPKPTASKIMLMLTPDLGRDVNVLRLVLKRYEEMNRDDCIIFLEKHGANFNQGHNNEKLARLLSKRKRDIETNVRQSEPGSTDSFTLPERFISVA